MLIQLPGQPGWRKPKWVTNKVFSNENARRSFRNNPLPDLWRWSQFYMSWSPSFWFEVADLHNEVWLPRDMAQQLALLPIREGLDWCEDGDGVRVSGSPLHNGMLRDLWLGRMVITNIHTWFEVEEVT